MEQLSCMHVFLPLGKHRSGCVKGDRDEVTTNIYYCHTVHGVEYSIPEIRVGAGMLNGTWALLMACSWHAALYGVISMCIPSDSDSVTHVIIILCVAVVCHRLCPSGYIVMIDEHPCYNSHDWPVAPPWNYLHDANKDGFGRQRRWLKQISPS